MRRITPARQEHLNKGNRANDGETLHIICLAKDKVISSSLLGLLQSPSLHSQIKTRRPDINWKKRSEMFDWSGPEIPLGGEGFCVSNKLSFLVRATEYNWLGRPSQRYIFHLATPPAIFHAQPSSTRRILINHDRKSSRVLLLDVSCTLGSNLLLQVAPYKPSVPSQVSQINKTKGSQIGYRAFSFFALRRKQKVSKGK